MPLIARLLLAALLLGLPGRALAAPACTAPSSGCGATLFTGNPTCCSDTACTIDVDIAPTASSCTYDFGTRAVTITGNVVLGSRTMTLSAGSLVLRGNVQGRGVAGATGGTFRVLTVGKRAPAFTMDADAAIIDLRGEAGGGTFELTADGGVVMTKGAIKVETTPPTVANVPEGSAGTVDMDTSAGDVTLGIAITASPGGLVRVHGANNISHEASQSKITALGGSVDVDAAGTLSLGEASRIDVTSDDGGAITLHGATVQAKGRLLADGYGSLVDVDASGGVLNIDRTNDISISTHGGELNLTADDESVNGRIMMGGLVEIFDGEMSAFATGDVTVTKKIVATGVLATDNTAGSVSVVANRGTVRLYAPILASAGYAGSVDVGAGRDVLVQANIEAQSTGATDGGEGGYVTVTAENDITVSQKTGSPVPQILASGASTGGYHGEITLSAGGDVTIASGVTLTMKGLDSIGGGYVTLEAGDGGLAGSVTIAGKIEALAGGNSFAPSNVSISGCDITVAAGALVDTRGRDGNGTDIIARKTITVLGQLLSDPPAPNAVPPRTGGVHTAIATTPLPVSGQVNPAFAACDCGDGTSSVVCCQRPACTGLNTPAGCLVPCPTCGDSVVQWPETCDVAACGTGDYCSPTCKLENCTDTNDCTANACDTELGCLHPIKADDTPCTDANACTENTTCHLGTCTGGTLLVVDDGDVCNGLETCNPTTGLVPGTPLSCTDANPCTTNACDPVAGCTVDNNTAACSDGDPCSSGDACQGGACRSGATSCPGQVCTVTGETFRCDACTSDADCNTDKCLGTRSCQAGQCVQTAPPPACATTTDTDLCDGFTHCDPQAADDGCVTDPHPACPNDGNACNGTSTCEPATGSCDPVAPVVCEPQDACHTVACVTATGACAQTAIPDCELCETAATCDDADACTIDSCGAGRCEHAAIDGCCTADADCQDASACTLDTCNLETNQCVSQALDGPVAGCGDSCHPDATCVAGVCETGSILDCEDADACTDDACTDGTCTHDAVPECCVDASVCDDGDACSTDACTDGTCTHVVADETCTSCATATDCDPRGTCAGMACVDGICVDAGTPSCDDGDVCTTDACPGAGGCTHTALAGCCHGVTECDDGDACTDDACGGPAGCSSTARTGSALVGCRLDGVETLLGGDGIATKTRKRLAKQLGLVRKTLAAVDTATGKKRTKLQARAAKQLGTLAKLVGKGAGKTIPADLAADLKDAVSAASSAVDSLG